MNRSKMMDEFLQGWAEVYRQNPNYPVDKNIIYKALMEYGLTGEELQNPDISPIFSAWERHFQASNLHVYQDSRQPLFLQFMSRGNLGRQHVKLYLSYPPDKIEYCVKKIFEFVSANHMVTGSKVANRVRSDSVVLRMTNYDDAIKVMNFISNNPELVQYAKSTNPFMMKQGVVGVSYDDNLSYNSTLSFMLEQYFKQCRAANLWDRVNHKHFSEFVNQYLNSSFKDTRGLQNFRSNSEVSQYLHRFSSPGEGFVNYEQVLKLIVMQTDGNMNMERFRSFYVEAKDSSKNRQMADYYNQLLNGQKETEPLEVTASMEEIALINGYIQFALQKYGNKSTVIAYLNKYINEENINAITRSGNFRTNFESNMSPKRAKFIMRNNVEAYVEEVLKPVKESAKPELEVIVNPEIKLLQDYIDLARKKYGDSGVVAYLADYSKGNLSAITKENNFRARFMRTLPLDRLQEITKGDVKTYIYSYIRNKYQTTLIDEIMYNNFVRASVATYQKYGYAQLEEAMSRGQEGKYSYFTNGTDRYRENMEILTPEMFKACCKRLVSTYGTNLAATDSIPRLCSQIIGQILQVQKEQTKLIS